MTVFYSLSVEMHIMVKLAVWCCSVKNNKDVYVRIWGLLIG